MDAHGCTHARGARSSDSVRALRLRRIACTTLPESFEGMPTCMHGTHTRYAKRRCSVCAVRAPWEHGAPQAALGPAIGLWALRVHVHL